MKGKLYAAFMGRRGRPIFEGAGLLARRESAHDHEHPVSRTDGTACRCRPICCAAIMLGARYLTREGNGLDGGLYLRRKSPYDMSVHHMSRNRLRRGLDKCTVREVERGELLKQGLAAQSRHHGPPGTLRCRVRRAGPVAPRGGGELCEPRRVCHRCFVEGALAAHAITLTEEGCIHILHVFSSARFLDDFFPARR